MYDQVDHFPPEAPENAKLSFSSGPLQAGGFLYLKVYVSQYKFNRIREKAERDSIYQFTGDEYDMSIGQSTRHHAFNRLDTIDADHFSGDWTIYVLGHTDPAEWNHGQNYGYVLNDNTNEVIYYRESW